MGAILVVSKWHIHNGGTLEVSKDHTYKGEVLEVRKEHIYEYSVGSSGDEQVDCTVQCMGKF
jgi:hypothetical protein